MTDATTTWLDDCEVVDPPIFPAVRRGLLMNAVLIAAAVAYGASDPRMLLVFVLPFAAACVTFMYSVRWVRAVRARGVLRLYQESGSGPPPGLGAYLHQLARPYSPVRRGGLIDAARYLDAVGPHGPRVVVLDPLLALNGAPTDEVREEVDVLAERTTPRWVWVWFAFMIVFVCLMVWFVPGASRRGPSLMPYAMMIPMFVSIVLVMGPVFEALAPVRWRVAVAAPGTVGYSAGFKRIEFARADSVLVIAREMKQKQRVVAQLIRRDGRCVTLWLGNSDRAVRALLSRWCYPALAGLHVAGVSVDSPPEVSA